MIISDVPEKDVGISTNKVFKNTSKDKLRSEKLRKINKKRISNKLDKKLLNRKAKKEKSRKLRIRKRSKKSKEVTTNLSSEVPLEGKKNVKGYPTFEGMNEGGKVCSEIRIKDKLSAENVKDEGESADLCKKNERSEKRIKPNFSASHKLVTKVAALSPRVRLRSKKRRKSVKNISRTKELKEDNFKKDVNDTKPFKERGKRRYCDPQKDDVEFKRRSIESVESYTGPQKQYGNNSTQNSFQERKPSTDFVKGHSKVQNKIVRFDDNEKPFSKIFNKPIKLLDVAVERHEKRIKLEGEGALTNKIQPELENKKNKKMKSAVYGNRNSIKILSGNGENKIIRFDENEKPSSKNFNKPHKQQNDASNDTFCGETLSGTRHDKRIKLEGEGELSNKIQPELGNKKNKKMKSEKEIASSIEDKNDEKQVDNLFSKDALPSTQSTKKKMACLSLRERMLSQLKSSKFRYLNQQLYTSDSNEANVLFQKDPDLFQKYHEGFKRQVEQWPINPIDRIIKSILRRPRDLVVADFGCGDAKLAKSVPNKVHSFDLVALSDEVTVCDMANTPLKDASVDICVFCLSLMGTNLQSFMLEANRVLKMNGVLKIAEVASRFEKVESFINDLKKYGFAFANKDLSHELFYFLNFTKASNMTKPKYLPPLYLKPCMYKKR